MYIKVEAIRMCYWTWIMNVYYYFPLKIVMDIENVDEWPQWTNASVKETFCHTVILDIYNHIHTAINQQPQIYITGPLSLIICFCDASLSEFRDLPLTNTPKMAKISCILSVMRACLCVCVYVCVWGGGAGGGRGLCLQCHWS